MGEMHPMNSKSVEEKDYGEREGKNCEDKISSLPDDLLIHILMFLPTRDAVATMLLSKRWRSIWKMVPRLEYKESTNKERGSVWWFLDNSMQQHMAPILESLSIELGERCPIDADVSKWIAKAVDGQVRELNLSLMWSAASIALPISLYTSETLVVLNLSGEILIDVPSSVRLTSLKKLCLSGVVYKEEVSIDRLLSGCPELKELSVKRCRNDNVAHFRVEVPSLKKLRYIIVSKDNIGTPLFINCPGLKNLHINDTFGPCSFGLMPSLDRLSVNYKFWNPDGNFRMLFSSVMTLRLTMTRGMVRCCEGVYFPRLRALTIFQLRDDGMDPLLSLLRNSPILRHLEINSERSIRFPHQESLPFQQYPVPNCLSSSLKEFKWRSYRRQMEDRELAAYILRNSKRLKYAEFHMARQRLDTKKMLSEELNSMVRVPTSNLKVYLRR